MNNEDINGAIAEHLGWEKVSGGFGIETRYKGTPSETRVTLPVPNYCGDLNAMHEAEKVLDVDIMKAGSPRYVYSTHLYTIVAKDCQPFRATARQRAEAFLRTVGKWKENE